MGPQVNNIFQYLSVGGAFAVVVIYLVLKFSQKAKKRDEPTALNVDDLLDIQKKVESIHDILHVRDSDGTPLCYFPRSLSSSIDDLTTAIREQTRMMQHLDLHLHEARDDLKDIQKIIRS